MFQVRSVAKSLRPEKRSEGSFRGPITRGNQVVKRLHSGSTQNDCQEPRREGGSLIRDYCQQRSRRSSEIPVARRITNRGGLGFIMSTGRELHPTHDVLKIGASSAIYFLSSLYIQFSQFSKSIESPLPSWRGYRAARARRSSTSWCSSS